MKNNKLLYLLVSVFVAFAMWLYVVTVVSPESEDTFYNVPVVFKGEDQLQAKGLMLIMEEKPTVTLKLTGNRTDLVKLNPSNITVTADLSKITDPGEMELGYSVSYPADVSNGAIGLQSKTPGNIKLMVERKITDKAVDIVINENGAVPADCIVQERSLSVRQVLLTGPKSVVDQITIARIDVDMDERDKTFVETFRFTLCDVNGNPVDAELIETDVGSVDLTVVVQKIKEVALKVTVIDGGGASEMTSDISIEPQTIKVSGLAEDLEGLDVLNLGTINLADYSKDTTKEFNINLPAGVKDLGNNEKAAVTVGFPELGITELTVTNIEAVNVPEGMEAEILARALVVRIRGPKTQMPQMTPDDVKIIVDFKGAALGNFNATAQVVITNTAYSTAGALGSYLVAVSLKEAETE